MVGRLARVLNACLFMLTTCLLSPRVRVPCLMRGTSYKRAGEFRFVCERHGFPSQRV